MSRAEYRRDGKFYVQEMYWGELDKFCRRIGFYPPILREYAERKMPDAPLAPEVSPTGLALRDYQRVGAGMLTMPGGWLLEDDMGLGKTCQILTAYQLLRTAREARGVIVFAPASVVEQWSEESEKFLGYPAYCIMSQGDVLNVPNQGVVVCAYSKVWRDPYQGKLLQMVREGGWVLAFDEVHKCFPASTLITTREGPIPIGILVENKVQTDVLSRHPSGRLEWKKITNHFKNKDTNLVRVTHTQGHFDCTPGHKIWTKEKGYMKAGDLTNETLLNLRCSIPNPTAERSPRDILFPRMRRQESPKTRSRESSRGATRRRRVLPSDDKQQPYAQRRNSPEAVLDIAGHRTQTPYPGRERTGTFPTPTDTPFLVGTGVENGIRDTHQTASNLRLPHMLQSRSSPPQKKAGNRGPWEQSQLPETTREGREKTGSTSEVRVVSVRRLEQTDKKFPDGNDVYDITVDGNHNYFADGILVSNSGGYGTTQHQALCALIVGSKYRWASTGTGVRNQPDSILPTYRLVTGIDLHPAHFRAYYSNSVGDWNLKKLEQIQVVRRQTGVRRTKAEVLTELPPLTEVLHQVSLTPQQARMLQDLADGDALVKYHEDEDPEILEARGILAWYTRALQITSHPRLCGGTPEKTEKWPILEDILRSLRDNQGIVWSYHPETLELLHSDIEQIGIKSAVIHGGVPQKKRDEIRKAFVAGKFPVLLANPLSYGEGVNLQCASEMVYWDEHYSKDKWEQSRARAYRMGQTKPVTIHYLRTKGTVEMKCYEWVRKKKEMADRVTGEAKHV